VLGSNDLPSGLNATTGEAPGAVVRADRTLTLALPKVRLQRAPGDLYLADIGIPPEALGRLGFSLAPPSRDGYWLRLVAENREEPIQAHQRCEALDAPVGRTYQADLAAVPGGAASSAQQGADALAVQKLHAVQVEDQYFAAERTAARTSSAAGRLR